MKYNAGDKVRCVNIPDGMQSDSGFTLGNIYVIRTDSDDYVQVLEDDDGDENGWIPEHFELVYDEKIQLKVGDKVVIKPNAISNFSNRNPGLIGTIENVEWSIN